MVSFASSNSYNTLTDDNKEARKTNTLDIGDYQSLVLRSVRITILLNHDNSFWTQLRLYEALDMVQEEQPKKFILYLGTRFNYFGHIHRNACSFHTLSVH